VGLTKHYGRKCGLHNLDLQVEDGEIFGLVGPKGAGKTTFINLMMDFIAPTKGIGIPAWMDKKIPQPEHNPNIS